MAAVKLAEALVQRADMQKRMAQLASRIVQQARHQEGEDPVEDAAELLLEYERLAGNLEDLIVRINVQNLVTMVEGSLTMTAALARRDRLRQQHRMRSDLADAASQGVDRYSKSEIKFLPSVDVRELRKQADELAGAARELDTLIQSANWTTEME
jgi:hypothetical protein